MDRTRLLVLDVDGTLTGGEILVDPVSGEEWRAYDVHDGFAIRAFQHAGGVVAICTGKGGGSVTHRAKVLGIEHVIERSADKAADVAALADRLGVPLAQTAMMGDDLPDVPAMKACGLAIAPANARPEVQAAADLVTERAGGDGAVREAVEHLLRAAGAWSELLDRYRVGS